MGSKVSGMAEKDTARASDCSGFHFPGGERRAAPYPEPDSAWFEMLLQSSGVPARVAQEDVAVGASAVAVFTPVTGGQRRKVQDSARQAAEVRNGASRRTVIEVLQHVVANHEVEGIRLPLGE